MNMSLKRSSETKKPVRVIRGYKLRSIYGPESGYVFLRSNGLWKAAYMPGRYRYDGLYIVEKAWTEPGLNPQGYKVVKFAFKVSRET
jgi:E3 ubiquitin-protein ligase UHRF1